MASEPVVAVGASGAIFGLYGTYIALLQRSLSEEPSSLCLKEIIIFVAINLLVGLLPGIDNAAHIGGLLCGLLLPGFLSFPSSQAVFKSYAQGVGHLHIYYMVSLVTTTRAIALFYV